MLLQQRQLQGKSFNLKVIIKKQLPIFRPIFLKRLCQLQTRKLQETDTTSREGLIGRATTSDTSLRQALQNLLNFIILLKDKKEKHVQIKKYHLKDGTKIRSLLLNAS